MKLGIPWRSWWKRLVERSVWAQTSTQTDGIKNMQKYLKGAKLILSTQYRIFKYLKVQILPF